MLIKCRMGDALKKHRCLIFAWFIYKKIPVGIYKTQHAEF